MLHHSSDYYNELINPLPFPLFFHNLFVSNARSSFLYRYRLIDTEPEQLRSRLEGALRL